MRVSLELWECQVNIVIMTDDDDQAEAHFAKLEEQLRSGIITFTVTEMGGLPPALEGGS